MSDAATALDQPDEWAGADTLVAALWPDVSARLADRASAFFATAARKCAMHGLDSFEARARYLSLCFMFGPAFEDRPENEWALALLADERLDGWVKVHQLAKRAGAEVARRGGDRSAFERIDNALLDMLDRRLRKTAPDASPLPRVACDLDALDMQAFDSANRREYTKVDGLWQLADLMLVDGIRIDREKPVPQHLSLLASCKDQGPVSRLRLRQIMHAHCSERHPSVRFIDAIGPSAWHGHEAGAVSWPVYAMAQPAAAKGFGATLVEETSPAVHLLQIDSCAVRDEGVPVGEIATQVWAWPAEQWLFQLQRQQGELQSWPRTRTPGVAPPPLSASRATRARVECDGKARDGSAWTRAFDMDLNAAIDEGLDRLFAVWSAQSTQPSMQALADVLIGRATLTWGWKKPRGGLVDPLLRVAAELDLGCRALLELSGEFAVGAARTRLRLSTRGESKLEWSTARETPDTPLLETLMPAVLRFRHAFDIEFEPIATSDGLVMSECGPCSGALTGEAGLRPRLSGSGWQWYVKLAVEPVLAPIALHDPVLGVTRRSLSLLPATALVDWSVG